jgi:hypothetical protein
MATQLITAHYGTMSVLFQTDGFINATVIAKQFGKKTENYLRTNETKAYIAALEKYLFPAGNSITPKSVNEQNQLVIVKSGAPETGGGTWLHPKLTVHFARWLSPDFAVWCDLQIEKILHSSLMNDSLCEFLKPITEPITVEDFEWRYHVTLQTLNHLKKARLKFISTMTGEEFLAIKYSEN